jgi:hypothetical protein
MRKIANLFLVFPLLIAGCGTQKNMVETIPLYRGDTISLEGTVYSLPMTVFRLDVELTRTRTIRGPYYRFAEKLLSIKDVPQQSSTIYRVDGLQLESFEEADPDHMYLIKQTAGSSDLSALLALGREGLIFRDRQTSSSGEPLILPESSSDKPWFTELSMERTTMMSIDTFYKTILTDTSFVRVPVLKEQLMHKTIDEKAGEAADFILELRYERFMMLTGNNNTAVTDYAVKRLDEIERQYLGLFTGKTFEEKLRYSFYVIPEGEETFENIEVFEFSDKQGVLEESSGDSEVLSLSIRKTGKTELLKDPLSPEKLPVRSNSLYYRVPDMCELAISLGGRTLLSGRYPVQQCGEILAMPAGPAEQKGLFPGK